MKRRLMGLVAALAMFAFQGGPATSSPSNPIVNLPNTPLTSPNVHWLGNVPTGVGVGGYWMGQYFFQTTAKSGSFLPGGPSTGGVQVFDAINPELPVLVASLPLPHWENEDVDLSPERGILLVTAERIRTSVPLVTTCDALLLGQGADPSACPVVPPMLFVIDISTPTVPKLRSRLEMPSYIGKDSNGALLRGPGHIAQCILQCRFAYITGVRNEGVSVVDLRDLDNPKMAATDIKNSPAGYHNSFYPERGAVHDANVDPQGYIWMTGSGGTAMYAPVHTDAEALHPKLLKFVKAVDNKYNGLIHHSSMRLDAKTVMVNEESYASQCGWHRNAVDENLRDDLQEGSFQTWGIDDTSTLKPVGMWKSEVADYTHGGSVVSSCSSHWFTLNKNKIVAIGWYDQGVRFLNVSDPKHIKQVGYSLQPNSSASAAYFVPWRPDLVYVADYNRGFDVLKIDNGGKGAQPLVAPMRAEWFSNYKGVRFTPPLKPDPDFGYACLRPSSIDW